MNTKGKRLIQQWADDQGLKHVAELEKSAEALKRGIDDQTRRLARFAKAIASVAFAFAADAIAELEDGYKRAVDAAARANEAAARATDDLYELRAKTELVIGRANAAAERVEHHLKSLEA